MHAPPEPPGHPFASAKDAAYAPPPDEVHTAFLAHLFAAAAALCSGGLALGVLAPYLATTFTGNKGPFALYHVNQAAWLQIMVSLVTFTLGLGGVMCCPLWALIPISWLVLGVGLPVYVAFEANRGAWAEYPWIGARVLRTWRPIFT